MIQKNGSQCWKFIICYQWVVVEKALFMVVPLQAAQQSAAHEVINTNIRGKVVKGGTKACGVAKKVVAQGAPYKAVGMLSRHSIKVGSKYHRVAASIYKTTEHFCLIAMFLLIV